VAFLCMDKNGEWAFKHGKHIGKTIDEVAKEAPSYLVWMFDSKVIYDLDNKAYYALVDVMGEHHIDVP